LTSFLYGGNADYIEGLYARWQEDPRPSAEWQDFSPASRIRRRAQERAGPPGKRPIGRVQANGDLVSALDGNWGESEAVVDDKLKAKAAAKGESGADSQADVTRRRRAIRSAPS
jgi:2-oxoglutarate dehydrogenase E1 component